VVQCDGVKCVSLVMRDVVCGFWALHVSVPRWGDVLRLERRSTSAFKKSLREWSNIISTPKEEQEP
jgi:hypothetical protein